VSQRYDKHPKLTLRCGHRNTLTADEIPQSLVRFIRSVQADSLQKRSAKTQRKNAVPKRSAKMQCKNAVQKHIAKMQCKNAMQNRSAQTHV
jgi:hypothetical protein